jgi:dTMP kinase
VFVTFEGIDGSGKTTQAELLVAALRADGRNVVATREPGGTELGERVRALLLEHDVAVAPWAEAALFAAARAQLVDEVIRPAVASGADVVCDRYVDSSLAYQGIARGLGVEHVLELNLRVTQRLLPDRTFLIVLAAGEAARRSVGDADRIEREGLEFQTAVGRAYEEVAAMFPERITSLDGSRPAAELARIVGDGVRDLS